MDENKLRFGVGVLVISSIGVAVILTFLFGAFPSVLNRDYTLTVTFPSAEGIGSNTPVIRDGVRIGRVADINLRPEGGVLVTLAMSSDQVLTHEYVPRISSGNFVTGDSKLEFVRADPLTLAKIFNGDREILAKPYSDDEFINYGEKSESLLEMQAELQDTFNAIRKAGDSIEQAGTSVNALAVEARQVITGTDSDIGKVADEAVKALEEFQGAMRDIRSIVGNPELKADLEESLTQLPQLLSNAQEALASTKQTFEKFEQVGVQFERVGVAAEQTVNTAQRTINNVEQFTEPLGERGGELVEQVIRSLTKIEGALTEVEAFGRTLNNSDGALKRFLDDDEIYWQVRRTVENIEQASARIRPIMDDVRIFTDKVARDPRELGVRGAISKRGSGLGIK